MHTLSNTIFELIKNTSCVLPSDVEAIIKYHASRETKESAKFIFDKIIDNIKIAKEKMQPICQDTGVLNFFIKKPANSTQTSINTAIKKAVSKATKEGYLRKNVITPISGKVVDSNFSTANPVIYYSEHKRNTIDISLILKGGGSENVGIQYSLPNTGLKAERDINGIKTCILDAVKKAEGLGCAPGVLGVCIGGDRASAYKKSKEIFLRKFNQQNKNTKLAKLEKEIVRLANKTNIGPMGLGGKTTLLGCMIEEIESLPASFFVTISYMCWAYRRRSVEIKI